MDTIFKFYSSMCSSSFSMMIDDTFSVLIDFLWLIALSFDNLLTSVYFGLSLFWSVTIRIVLDLYDILFQISSLTGSMEGSLIIFWIIWSLLLDMDSLQSSNIYPFWSISNSLALSFTYLQTCRLIYIYSELSWYRKF